MSKNQKIKDIVVVTGSSTGIGLTTAETLAKNGFHILAGVRNSKDQQKLEALHVNIQAFILDVASTESINEAFKAIRPSLEKALRVSVVNNAGIVVPGPIEGLRRTELQKQFDVNVFGLVEWTQLLLPMIRETKGKIINISSVSGLVSSPFMGAYAASKYALEAISDALRRELLRFGVEVILIEPGPIKTPIWSKGIAMKEDMHKVLREGMAALYSKEISRMVQRVEKTPSYALPVENVANKILSCMKRKQNPARVLVVGPTVGFQVKMAQMLPTKIADRALSKYFYK